MTLEEQLATAKAEGAQLSAELATAKATIEQLTTSQAAIKADLAAIRTAQATDLLKQAGVATPTPEQIAPYVEMTSAQFAAVSMLAKPVKVDLSGKEIATEGTDTSVPPTIQQSIAKLNAQVAGITPRGK